MSRFSPKTPKEVEDKIRELRESIKYAEASIIERRAWLDCLRWVAGE